MDQTHTQTHRRRRHARSGRVVAVAIAAAFVVTGCLSTDQNSDVTLVNNSRKANRLTALSADVGASQKAQRWSQRMAGTGVLEHTGGGSKVDTSGLTKWCSVGENVGTGPSLSGIHTAFMRSNAHKAHILGNYHRIGVGVYKKGGTYWVTEIYIRNC